MRVALSLGHRALQAFWRKIAFSLNCVWKGVRPSTDEDGTPWELGSYEAKMQGLRIGLPESPRARLTEIRGDWKWLDETFTMKNSYKGHCVCFRDSAATEGQLQYTDYSQTPPWVSAQRTTQEFIAEMLPQYAPCDGLNFI